jgi:hypothetical protein
MAGKHRSRRWRVRIITLVAVLAIGAAGFSAIWYTTKEGL